MRGLAELRPRLRVRSREQAGAVGVVAEHAAVRVGSTVLTAPARSAREVSSFARSAAALLCGSVTLMPHPPC